MMEWANVLLVAITAGAFFAGGLLVGIASKTPIERPTMSWDAATRLKVFNEYLPSNTAESIGKDMEYLEGVASTLYHSERMGVVIRHLSLLQAAARDAHQATGYLDYQHTYPTPGEQHE